MIHWNLTQARLVQRYKRFLADIDNGLTIHCPNTGAMAGMREPGSLIGYQPTSGGKTAGRWVLIETSQGLACVDSAAANRWVRQSIAQWQPEYQWQAEVKLGDRRIDFRGQAAKPFWIEVKGVTWALGDGQGAFPDAKSVRAREHLNVLSERVKAGERAAILYVIMHNGIDRVRAATEIDPEYAQVLDRAIQQGIEVWQWPTELSWSGVEMGAPERLA